MIMFINFIIRFINLKEYISGGNSMTVIFTTLVMQVILANIIMLIGILTIVFISYLLLII
jgi:hypothetical protein